MRLYPLIAENNDRMGMLTSYLPQTHQVPPNAEHTPAAPRRIGTGVVKMYS